jgi:hypothetical protein
LFLRRIARCIPRAHQQGVAAGRQAGETRDPAGAERHPAAIEAFQPGPVAVAAGIVERQQARADAEFAVVAAQVQSGAHRGVAPFTVAPHRQLVEAQRWHRHVGIGRGGVDQHDAAIRGRCGSTPCALIASARSRNSWLLTRRACRAGSQVAAARIVAMQPARSG